MPSSRRSFQPKDQTQVSYVSCMLRWSLYHYHHLGSPERRDMDVYSIRLLPFLCSKYPTVQRRKSHEQKSLMGYRPWGHKESDTTKATQRTHIHVIVQALSIASVFCVVCFNRCQFSPLLVHLAPRDSFILALNRLGTSNPSS